MGWGDGVISAGGECLRVDRSEMASDTAGTKGAVPDTRIRTAQQHRHSTSAESVCVREWYAATQTLLIIPRVPARAHWAQLDCNSSDSSSVLAATHVHCCCVMVRVRAVHVLSAAPHCCVHCAPVCLVRCPCAECRVDRVHGVVHTGSGVCSAA